MIRRRRGFVALVLVVGLAAPWPASADLLYFKRGGAVQLPSRRVGSRVIVEAPWGEVEFAAGDFSRIVPGGDPAREWPGRLASARKDGGDATLAAAWWSLENGLTREATEVLRELHVADPGHEPALGLVRTLDAITPAVPAPGLSGLKASLGGTFLTRESPHFVLLYQTNEQDAATRLGVLEQVYVAFYLTFAGQGLSLRPPREKLVAAAYGRRADYLAFLARERADAFGSTLGYYHPTRKAVVSFDPRDLPMLRKRAEAVAAGRDTARLTLLLELEQRAIDLGMAAHEATHQLVAASGLAPHHDDFPTWLHEGLAAQFEVVRGGRWAGVGRANDLRLPDWRALRPLPALLPVTRDEGFGVGYRRDLYAEAWSLVFFLRKAHPREFARYLDVLRAPSAESRTDERCSTLFRSAVGADLPQLEVEWHRYLKTVLTPLEASAPR